MSKNKKAKDPISCRLGRVGGQAVLEGVMMRSGDNVSLAVREESGDIAVKNSKFVSVRKKHKFCNIPVFRGCVNFIEMLKLSYSTLSDSAKMLGMDELDEETKFDKWLKDKLGDKVMAVIMTIASVIGIALAFALFTLLPMKITTWIKPLIGKEDKWVNNFVLSLISGVIRIIIFILYMYLVSLMKDIRRTFEYHGAEHKSIACYEAGRELTPANAKEYTRFHPRCGTSFIFVILIISILIFSLVPWKTTTFADKLIMIGLRLCLLPIVTGIGFEFLMLAGKHPNKFTLALSYPGLLMQRITTKEPDESQLEIAITALKCAMPDEFPDEYAYYEAKSKEKEEKEKEEKEQTAENASENAEGEASDNGAENEIAPSDEAESDK